MFLFIIIYKFPMLKIEYKTITVNVVWDQMFIIRL